MYHKLTMNTACAGFAYWQIGQTGVADNVEAEWRVKGGVQQMAVDMRAQRS